MWPKSVQYTRIKYRTHTQTHIISRIHDIEGRKKISKRQSTHRLCVSAHHTSSYTQAYLGVRIFTDKIPNSFSKLWKCGKIMSLDRLDVYYVQCAWWCLRANECQRWRSNVEFIQAFISRWTWSVCRKRSMVPLFFFIFSTSINYYGRFSARLKSEKKRAKLT